jgi:hypothetical protein
LRVLGIAKHVDDLDRPAFQRSSPDERLSPRGKLPDEHELFDSLVFLLGMAVARRPTVDLAVAPEQPHVVRVAKPGRRLRKRIEHCLQIEGGAADHLEHVSGGCLLLQRVGELAFEGRQILFFKAWGARRCADRRGGAAAKVLALRRLAIAMPYQVLVRIRTWKLSKDISATCHHR